ncbi:clumping factor A-like [Branchiostoma lanceolatum]|uniref:clumping factor A-like n=1 Tax=Branchiostoma lanceolatum TaxID=7740 RepID=UPI003452BA0D
MTRLTDKQQTDIDSYHYDDQLTYVTTNSRTDIQSKRSEFTEMQVNNMSSDLDPTTLTNMAASDLTDVSQLTDSDSNSLTLTDANQISETHHTSSRSISSLTDILKTGEDILQDNVSVSETHTENYTDTPFHTDSYTSFSDSEPGTHSKVKIPRVATIDNLHLAESDLNSATHFTDTDAKVDLEEFENEPRNNTYCEEQSIIFDDDLHDTVDQNLEVMMADGKDEKTSNDTQKSSHDSQCEFSAEEYESDSSDTIDHALKTYLSQELSETEIESDLESRAEDKEQQSNDLEVVDGKTETEIESDLESRADDKEQQSDDLEVVDGKRESSDHGKQEVLGGTTYQKVRRSLILKKLRLSQEQKTKVEG